MQFFNAARFLLSQYVLNKNKYRYTLALYMKSYPQIAYITAGYMLIISAPTIIRAMPIIFFAVIFSFKTIRDKIMVQI